MKISQNHYFITCTPYVISIASPLKQWGIDYFFYCKLFNDGSRIVLTTHSEDFHDYLTYKQYLKGNFFEVKPDFHLPNRVALLWSSLPNQQNYQYSRMKYEIDHGISLIQSDGRSNELFAFATKPNHPNAVNFYINNLDLLGNFILYFKEKSQPLILSYENHKITYPYHNMILKKQILQASTSNNISRNLVNTYLTDSLKRNIKLTSREHEVLQFFMCGYTAKEIANMLNISYRTIETHMEHIKKKFGVTTKSKLMQKIVLNNNQ